MYQRSKGPEMRYMRWVKVRCMQGKIMYMLTFRRIVLAGLLRMSPTQQRVRAGV